MIRMTPTWDEFIRAEWRRTGTQLLALFLLLAHTAVAGALTRVLMIPEWAWLDTAAGGWFVLDHVASLGVLLWCFLETRSWPLPAPPKEG